MHDFRKNALIKINQQNWDFLTFFETFKAVESCNEKYFRNFSQFSVVLEVFRDFLEIFLRFFVIKNEMFETFSRFLISKYRLLVRSRLVPPLRTSLFFWFPVYFRDITKRYLGILLDQWHPKLDILKHFRQLNSELFVVMRGYIDINRY